MDDIRTWMTLVEDTENNNSSVKLWESAGIKIKEAKFTPDQITQLFQNVEKFSSDSGTNRTTVGKGKDAATAVNNAWNDLKTKVQNSGPIKNADAQYDQVAEKLRQATGGDKGVMRYVQKYRDFAKKHPIAQSLIYAALIAAAGISGAGAGGAAALGLLKMTDKLLQGEKFSSAAYSGAKTGATAYAAGQVGQHVKGDAASGADTSTGSLQGGYSMAVGDIDPKTGKELLQFLDGGTPVWGTPGTTPAQLDAMRRSLKGESFSAKGRQLTEFQIYALFADVVMNESMLNEAYWDDVKGKVSKFGKNLTTKFTVDKLQKAWKNAGAPRDSNKITRLLRQQGVDANVIKKSFLNVGSPDEQDNSTGQDEKPSAPTQSRGNQQQTQNQPIDTGSVAPKGEPKYRHVANKQQADHTPNQQSSSQQDDDWKSPADVFNKGGDKERDTTEKDDKYYERLNQIKKVIRNEMSDQQRKMLYRMLKNG